MMPRRHAFGLAVDAGGPSTSSQLVPGISSCHIGYEIVAFVDFVKKLQFQFLFRVSAGFRFELSSTGGVSQ